MGSHEVRWMFHSTAIVPDYDRAVAELQALAGLRVLQCNENPRPEIGRRGGMTWLGDNSLEIGEPIVESGGAARFIARAGGGMHSVALQVRDLDATMEHLRECGVRIAARPLPEMCFTDPRDTGGVFFQWAVFELGVDPRFGTEPADVAAEPLLGIREHAFIGALVDDPIRQADLYCQLLGTRVTFEEPGASPGSPRIGVSLGDCTLALYAAKTGQSAALWGQHYEQARTHLMALRADDLSSARQALLEARVPLVRADASVVVIDPKATGGVQTAIVDRLLPGDPRVQLPPTSAAGQRAGKP
jgi:catechol 2,3-dioxygenase-like lactoylglutathione lyase family enzyme